ncbi:hypothetical protein R69776_03797 [Paraburkholderia nemoris]|uniref:Uncharacterized protein n=1 Tax=Paraburkholderia nemoris TaxID=2793076 RepID=A0ABN7LUK9_9BURK|nr:hypothetical protein R69776_03797 [Paraburkholderia nemoris]
MGGPQGAAGWSGSVLSFFAFAALVVRGSGLGAFPCIVSGLLALPLCGAALTFFAAAKKDKQRKRLEAPAKWAPWSAAGSGATGIRVLSHSTLVTKDSSAPTPHCVRRGRVCMGNHGLRFWFVGAIGFASATCLCTLPGNPPQTICWCTAITVPVTSRHSHSHSRGCGCGYRRRLQLPLQLQSRWRPMTSHGPVARRRGKT